jgi:hypothetical protein
MIFLYICLGKDRLFLSATNIRLLLYLGFRLNLSRQLHIHSFFHIWKSSLDLCFPHNFFHDVDFFKFASLLCVFVTLKYPFILQFSPTMLHGARLFRQGRKSLGHILFDIFNDDSEKGVCMYEYVLMYTKQIRFQFFYEVDEMNAGKFCKLC